MKLLVVEDNGHHRCSAKKFFAEKAGVEARFVETLASFDKAVYEHRFDGVLSDIFFPCGKMGGLNHKEEVPAGVAVYFICQFKSIPCVLVTAGYHHGKKYQWIHHMVQELKLPPIIDYFRTGDLDAEEPEKNWARAFQSLVTIIGQK